MLISQSMPASSGLGSDLQTKFNLLRYPLGLKTPLYKLKKKRSLVSNLNKYKHVVQSKQSLEITANHISNKKIRTYLIEIQTTELTMTLSNHRQEIYSYQKQEIYSNQKQEIYSYQKQEIYSNQKHEIHSNPKKEIYSNKKQEIYYNQKKAW